MEETPLPFSLIAVLCCAFLQSFYFVKYKPFSDSPKGAWSTYVRAISDCRVGSPKILLLYRTLVFIYCAAVGVRQGTVVPLTFLFRFYTVWNWWLLVLYFGLAALVSFRAVFKGKSDADRKLGALEYSVVVLMHMHLTTVLIVDVLTWGVLVPMLKANPNPTLRLSMFYTFTSYNQHGANAAFIYLDMLLSFAPIYIYMLGYVGLFGTMYGTWAIIHHKIFGWWLYPFLDSSKPWAPLAYIGLLLIHWIFFFAAVGITQIRKIFPRQRLAVKTE